MESWADMQRWEDGSGPRPLAFTADDMAEWDEDDYEAAGLAMERDMYERAHLLEQNALSFAESGDTARAAEMALEALQLRQKADA